MDLWLDSVFSVPVIGLQMTPKFGMMSGLAERIAPLLDEESDGRKVLSVRSPDGFQFQIDTPSGVEYKLKPGNIVVSFKHAMVRQSDPGHPPQLGVDNVAPYSDLLDLVRKQTHRLYKNVCLESDQEVVRIGIAASASLDPETLPPGIEEMCSHLAAPWGHPLIKSDTTLLAEVSSTAKTSDRCHHILRFDTTAEDPSIDLTLDWQRAFGPAPEMDSARLGKELDDACEAAQQYFQRVGEGDLAYGK